MSDSLDEAVTSGNEPIDYDALMQAVFDEAVGDDEPEAESRTLTRNNDEGSVTEIRRRHRPNIALAMKLLGDRIGGPQDYC